MNGAKTAVWLLVFAAAFIHTSVSCSSAKKKKDTVAAKHPTTVVEPGAKPEGVIVNRIRYTVGDVPITDMDIAAMEKQLQRAPLRPGAKRKTAVEELIERAIVDIEARAESIIVTDARIQTEMKRRMESAGIATEDDFRRLVERETGLPFDRWVEDMKYQFIRSQIVQVKLTIPQPEEKDVEEFYRKNRDRVGLEVMYREIAFRPRAGSIEDETRVSKMASDLVNKVRTPAAFAAMAKTHPENVSPYRFNGGLVDYVPLQDIADNDRVLAGVLFGMGVGAPQVFRDGAGRYVIIRIEDRRPVSYQKVRQLILQQLYFEKEIVALEKWIERRKKEVAVQKFD